MLYPSITRLLESTKSRYSLVIAVAKRARQIADEADINSDVLDDKPVKLAINDIAENKVNVVINEIEEEAPKFEIKQNGEFFDHESYDDEEDMDEDDEDEDDEDDDWDEE